MVVRSVNNALRGSASLACRGALYAWRQEPHNLSEWRKYGYQKWLALHTVMDEALALSEDSEELAATGVNCEKLLLALTASYAECTARKRTCLCRGAPYAWKP